MSFEVSKAMLSASIQPSGPTLENLIGVFIFLTLKPEKRTVFTDCDNYNQIGYLVKEFVLILISIFFDLLSQT